MTPLHLKIALHYYCHPYDYEEGIGEHFHSSATQDYIRQLIKAELLIKNEACARPLYSQNPEPMRAYIEALTSINLPTKKWVVE